MTVDARTLLNRAFDKRALVQDSAFLATLGVLEARLVKNFDGLDKVGRALAMRGQSDQLHMKHDKNGLSDHDHFIVVTLKERPDETLALCRLSLSERLNVSENFKTAGLVGDFEVQVNQKEPCFLTISPFEFTETLKVHRAQALLWHAIAQYCALYDVDYVVGSLAFNSRYPAAYALELSYLYHFCRAQSGLRAMAKNGVTMDIMPQEAIKPHEAFSALPPTLRYCLRLGAKVSENAIVDALNNQTRIFLLFPARTMRP
ncbi:hypothetical protein [Bartonella tamiae]|uniref:Uncharacterized protein n=1 Tax=Bartonella tamiae Th239 TaxID=1094558 RepID=J1K1U2_9HYPH|nr:hypothetical protein [Bartonella tamiae]EJF91045.1 hypothetical protein ME5_00377 [Bartonella tamiae Th239]EJF93290.1 hypothetical protein MEG_01504 [Bartonella tamiae Th307]